MNTRCPIPELDMVLSHRRGHHKTNKQGAPIENFMSGVAEAGRRCCRHPARPDLVCSAESQGISAPRSGAFAPFAAQSADGPAPDRHAGQSVFAESHVVGRESSETGRTRVMRMEGAKGTGPQGQGRVPRGQGGPRRSGEGSWDSGMRGNGSVQRGGRTDMYENK